VNIPEFFLDMVGHGLLSVDCATGIVTNPRTGRVIGTNSGVPRVSRYHLGLTVTITVARLVWMIGHGHAPSPLSCVMHLDGNPRNNCLANLRLANRQQVAINKFSRFTSDDVTDLRRIYATTDISVNQLCGQRSVAFGTMRRLLLSLRYANVTSGHEAACVAKYQRRSAVSMTPSQRTGLEQAS